MGRICFSIGGKNRIEPNPSPAQGNTTIVGVTWSIYKLMSFSAVSTGLSWITIKLTDMTQTLIN